MKLDLTYAEISLIRELLKKRRHALTETSLSGIPKIRTKSLDEVNALVKAYCAQRNPFLEHGVIGCILDKVQNLEKNIHADLVKDLFAPPTEDELRVRRKDSAVRQTALTVLEQVNQYLQIRINPRFRASEEYELLGLVQQSMEKIRGAGVQNEQ